MLNAFTVDVEDYFQVSAFEHHVGRDRWDEFPLRVEENTMRLLDLLDRHATRATFFVLGWCARRCPELVHEIRSRGHEIACHGFWHRLIYRQTPEEFRADLRAARNAIGEACGGRVTMYRAPSFSITGKSLWALDVLRDEGFLVDSSVFPVRHDRYGIPSARPDIHAISTSAGELWEFPPTVVRCGWSSVPVAGGGYFRLYPLPLTVRLLRRVNQRERRPFMFYVHPWEIDPEQPRIHGPRWPARFRHRVNLARTYDRLDELLRRFAFGTVSDVLAAEAACARAALPRDGMATAPQGMPLGSALGHPPAPTSAR